MTAPQIRTRPDGSIDTAHYMARGRNLRSQKAHRLAKGTGRRLSTFGVAAVTVLAVLLFLPVAA